MVANQTLIGTNGKQVALFPLSYVYVSQADDETYSHENWYYATDYMGWNASGRVYRCPCYAPVDIKCIYIDRVECMAVWESLDTVNLANGTVDYLGIIVYHDNDITNGLINVGNIKHQGEQFNRTGTGGNVTGDHVHLETGYGRYSQPNTSTPRGTANYKYHFTDYTDVKRLHNYDALYTNDTVNVYSPNYYIWKTYEGGNPSDTIKSKFKCVLYAKKIRERNKNLTN